MAEDVDPKRCQGHLCKARWRKNKSEPLHECPYQVQVNHNVVTLCNCCDACRQNCADDV